MSLTAFDPTRLDQLFQYALATAAQAEDFKDRELGPIHLLKYAYLADLAYAERNDGVTYTGVPWQFHHFGPWSLEAYARVAPSATRVGAMQRSFGTADANDAVRYRLASSEADALSRQLGQRLPYEVTSALSREIHQHGTDTADLLRHVYITRPMLNAEPGSILNFASVCRETAAQPWGTTEAEKLSVREKKLRRSILDSARAEVKRRLIARSATRVAPFPSPRYDEVFFEGTAMLDRDAGEPMSASSGEVRFDQSVWQSSQRRDPEVS